MSGNVHWRRCCHFNHAASRLSAAVGAERAFRDRVWELALRLPERHDAVLTACALERIVDQDIAPLVGAMNAYHLAWEREYALHRLHRDAELAEAA